MDTMTKIVPAIIFLFLFSRSALTDEQKDNDPNALPEVGKKVFAIQEIHFSEFDEIIRGFESVCKQAVIKRVFLSDLRPAINIRSGGSDLILAIGDDTLYYFKSAAERGVPIVYTMVPNPNAIVSANDNITGVSMGPDPAEQLGVISKVFPGKKIGVLYSPRCSGFIIERARKAAGKAGIGLVTCAVSPAATDRHIEKQFLAMLGEFDIYWEIPDADILGRPRLPFLFHELCKKRGIPVITFNEMFLQRK